MVAVCATGLLFLLVAFRGLFVNANQQQSKNHMNRNKICILLTLSIFGAVSKARAVHGDHVGLIQRHRRTKS